MRLRNPSERERDWLMVIPVGGLYFVLQSVMQVERAFIAALTVGVFYVIISREWDKRYRKAFWIFISVFALIHVIALLSIKLPHYEGPGLAIALPFMFVDGFAMWSFWNWIDKKLPTHR